MRKISKTVVVLLAIGMALLVQAYEGIHKPLAVKGIDSDWNMDGYRKTGIISGIHNDTHETIRIVTKIQNDGDTFFYEVMVREGDVLREFIPKACVDSMARYRVSVNMYGYRGAAQALIFKLEDEKLTYDPRIIEVNDKLDKDSPIVVCNVLGIYAKSIFSDPLKEEKY